MPIHQLRALSGGLVILMSTAAWAEETTLVCTLPSLWRTAKCTEKILTVPQDGFVVVTLDQHAARRCVEVKIIRDDDSVTVATIPVCTGEESGNRSIGNKSGPIKVHVEMKVDDWDGTSLSLRGTITTGATGR